MLGYTTLCNHKIIFQIAASFLTFIFHKVVQRLIYGVVGYFYMSLLQIYHRDCQRNVKIGYYLGKLWARV